MALQSMNEFVISRPFMFAIEINGIVLYVGSVRKPDIIQEREIINDEL